MEGPRKSISEFMHKVSERVDMRRRCSSPFRSPPRAASGSPAGQRTPQSPPRGEFICRELNQALLHILLPAVEANVSLRGWCVVHGRCGGDEYAGGWRRYRAAGGSGSSRIAADVSLLVS